jgi:HPt (histidine-containing phosphotransfer) domain-containing protein
MSELAAKEPIDLVHLARYTGGDRELNCEVFRLFSAHCAQSLRSLEALLNTAGDKVWRDTAHALRGAALGIGAFGLAKQAGAAEAMELGTDMARAAVVLAALRARSEVVLAYIEAYLPSE